MRTAVMGTHPYLAMRAEALRGRSDFVGEVQAADGLDLVFIGLAPAERFDAAAAALRAGANVHVEWPPATSLRECARLVRLAEEAGLEAAVGRPLRSGVPERADDWRAGVVSVEMTGVSALAHALADAIDLSFMLTRTASVRRVEAEAVHDDQRALISAAISLRFHSGAFAQALIRSGGPADGVRLYAAGRGHETVGTLQVGASALVAETHRVLHALEDGRPVPVSALDALQTMRTIERVMGVLR